FFVCHVYDDQPDPRSFPTRRSSDLGALSIETRCGKFQLHLAKGKAGELSWRHRRGCADASAASPMLRRMTRTPLARPEPAPCVGDRKSTRLHSSHVTISYAVFCLKK